MKRVEGYSFDEQDVLSPVTGGEEAWLADLREEARAALIRRIVMDRLANGGFSGAPAPVDLDSTVDDFGQMDDVSGGSRRPVVGTVLRDLAIGVGISVLSAWVCMRWGIGQPRKRK